MSKVLTRDELALVRERCRRDGRVLVQCHGCFDIVHPGHIRHLQHARRQGDVLLVSITADSGVNKGAGRPYFSQDLRAENLAALNCVDYVYINPEDTAVGLLGMVEPDVYIKGREYESNEDPRFAEERRTVESAGGRVVFSSGDVVYSSTALVGEIRSREDPDAARLNQIVETHGLSVSRLNAVTAGGSGKRVTVVGESILDTYITCDKPEVASESPVLALRPLGEVSFDGGAAVLALHLAAMGARPTLVTALPNSRDASAMGERLAAAGVEVISIAYEGRLLEKQRFLVGAQKVMKLDRVQRIMLDTADRRRFLSMAIEACTGADAAIFASFGMDLLSSKTLRELTQAVRREVGVMVGDVSGRQSPLLSMMDCDLLCPTEYELRAGVANADDSLNAVAWGLMEETRCRSLITTMGEEGLIAFERVPPSAEDPTWATRVRGESIPAMTKNPIDQLGCGDALLACATLALASGASLVEAAYLGSLAASVHAQRIGNGPVSRDEIDRACANAAAARVAMQQVRLVAH